jgi:hypothetical protein
MLSLALLFGFSGAAAAQDAPEASIYTFSGDAAVVSKYIWRGQRLTNDWSLQPAMTLSVKGFSFNAWGTIDLAAVNEGDALPIPENPLAPTGASGLKGKFSEIDYTFSYKPTYKSATFDVGTITYTFPERSEMFGTTTEIYGGVTFAVTGNPSAKLFVDVDETTAGGGDRGLYFLLSAGQSIPLNHPVFPSLDLSGSLAFANTGFANFFYGADESGVHDTAITVGLPIVLGKGWTAKPFFTYSALIQGFRDQQFLDPRKDYLGTAGTPKDSADTVWGGVNLNLTF